MAAALPFVCAVAVLQLTIPGGVPLSPSELATLRDLARPGTVEPGRLLFAAMVVIHLFTCAGAIGFTLLAGEWTRDRRLFATGLAMAGIVGAAVIAAVVSRGEFANLAFFRLTAQVFDEIYRPTASSGSPFVLVAILLPSLLGILAVSLVAAAATLDRLRPPELAAAARKRFAEGGTLSGGSAKGAKVLLAFSAPLLSAPLSELLQSVFV